ncbi:MAG: hypothetical protein QM493_07425 [Sulfurovum sp.]
MYEYIKPSIVKIIFILISFTLLGCQSVQQLNPKYSKNVNIIYTLKTPIRYMDGVKYQSTGAINKVIYFTELDKLCQKKYLGATRIKQGTISVGLPQDNWMLIKVAYSGLMLSRPTMSRSAYFKVRKGFSYEIQISYQKSINTIDIYEINPRTQARKDVYKSYLDNCAL